MMTTTALKTKKTLLWKSAIAVSLCILFLWLLYTPTNTYNIPLQKG